MKKTATAVRSLARVSLKDSVVLFKNIRNKPSSKAKLLLNDLINEKRSLNGRYYTGASKQILELLEESEKNAESQELNVEKLFVKEAHASKSLRYMLPKSRWSHRGKKAKICRLTITLGER